MRINSIVLALLTQLAAVSATGCEVAVTDRSGASVTQTLAENTTGDVLSSNDDATLCMATFKCIDSTQACVVGYIDGECASTTCNGVSGGAGSGAEGEFVTDELRRAVVPGEAFSGEKRMVGKAKRYVNPGKDFKGDIVDVGKQFTGEKRYVKAGEDFKGEKYVQAGKEWTGDQ